MPKVKFPQGAYIGVGDMITTPRLEDILNYDVIGKPEIVISYYYERKA